MGTDGDKTNVRWLQPDDFKDRYGRGQAEPAVVIPFPLERVASGAIPDLPEYLMDDSSLKPY